MKYPKVISSMVMLIVVGVTMLILPRQSSAFSVQIQNNSSYVIEYFYVSRCNERKWGIDRLGPGKVLHPGYISTLSNIPTGCYDVKLVDEEGDVCVKYNLDFVNGIVWSFDDGSYARCDATE